MEWPKTHMYGFVAQLYIQSHAIKEKRERYTKDNGQEDQDDIP